MKKVKNYYNKWQEKLAIGVSILYIIALTLCISLVSCSTYEPGTRVVPEIWSHNMSESLNDVDDMIEWMEWDIHEGVIDPLYGELYIENLEILRLRILAEMEAEATATTK